MKKKSITLIGVNYYPEDSAIGLYTTQKAEYLSEKGFNVSVITGFPYYPKWEISKEYNDKGFFYKETINNVNIYRYKQYVPKDPTFIKRILHLLSFTSGNFFNLFKLKKQDIVIAIIPFTASVTLGWYLKLRYKSKLWIHIQDFEFDAAMESGLLSENKNLIFKLLLNIEKRLLNKADIVSTISNGMLAKLKSKTNNNGYYLTNWLDTSKFNREFFEKHNFLKSSNFKILYSGNIGAKQDWESFFLFLDRLQNISNIEVIVVGEGAEEKRVKEKLDTYSFTKHYNLVPFDELPLLLSSADLHVLFQKDDVIDTVMPSKILGMMGSSRPSLVTGNKESEVAKIFKESNAGLYLENKELDLMISYVKKLIKNDSYAKILGNSAKTYVIENYDKTKVLDRFINYLHQL